MDPYAENVHLLRPPSPPTSAASSSSYKPLGTYHRTQTWRMSSPNTLERGISNTRDAEARRKNQSGRVHLVDLADRLLLVHLVCGAIIRPFMGRFRARFGSKKVLLAFKILFIIANVLFGVSKFITAGWLNLISRGLVGLSSAGVSSVIGALISSIATAKKKERGEQRKSRVKSRIQGWDKKPPRPVLEAACIRKYSTIATGLGNATGSVLGGRLANTQLGWPGAFFGVCVLAAILVGLGIKFLEEEPRERRKIWFDYPGAIAFALFLACLNTAVSIVRMPKGWTEGLSIALFVAAAVLFLVLLAVEDFCGRQKSRVVIIRIDLLAGTKVIWLHFATWAFNVSFYIILLYIPVYLQLRGMTGFIRGAWLMLPFIFNALGSILTSVLLFFKELTGRYPTWSGLGLISLGAGILQLVPTALLFSLSATSPVLQAIVIYTAMYFGLSSVNESLDRLIEGTTVKIQDQADKDSLSTTIQILKAACTSIGAGIGGHFYQGYLQQNNITISDIIKSPSTANVQIGVDALRNIFWWSVGFASAGLASFLIWYTIHLCRASKKLLRRIEEDEGLEGVVDWIDGPRLPSRPGSRRRSSGRR